MSESPRILVLRLSSLGDVILTAPVYRNLKEKWPDCRISVLVKPQFAQAIAGHPCVDEVIPFKGLSAALREIKERRFTHLLDLHCNFRTFLIKTFSGIPEQAAYSKNSLARRLFVKLRLQSPALQRHTLDRYLDSLSAWDIPLKYRTPELSDWREKNSARRQAPRRICFIQTAFLGDAVLTLPLLQKTKELFPEAEITVVARHDTADVFRAAPEVSSVLVDAKKQKGLAAATLELSGEMKRGNFDAVISPHRSFRSGLLARLSGAPLRIGFHTSAGRFFYNTLVPFSWLLHDAERNLALLTPLAPEGIAPRPVSMKEGEGPAQTVARLLGEQGIDGKTLLIGVNAGSAWPTKMWPAEYFSQAMRMISEKTGAAFILLGGKGDAALYDSIASDSGAKALNWAGKTSLPELMAVMPKLKLFITNDSGPMHIATAFNVPTLAIFGPTTRELGFFPYGKGHRVLEAKLNCRPCALHGGKTCPHGHFLCMKLIQPDLAASAALEMLSGAKS
ncbi:MAG: hypothetical protein GX410_00415 [Elusimicrobia bacterium]|nr:hypothetical protein [Elusimicrobiota bacterium]